MNDTQLENRAAAERADYEVDKQEEKSLMLDLDYRPAKEGAPGESELEVAVSTPGGIEQLIVIPDPAASLLWMMFTKALQTQIGSEADAPAHTE